MAGIVVPSFFFSLTMTNTFKCLRCGKCCKDLPLQKSEFDMFRYILKAEGRWDTDKAQYYPNKRIYKLKRVCPFLYEGIGQKSCMIYSFRPMVCKMFPLSNECPTTAKDK